jgi:uncharacterized small protein (DUF1192 family)
MPMPMDDDHRKPISTTHHIGEDLASLSVEELQNRISLLETEIIRLRGAIEAKNASRLAADQFFKR